MMPRKTKEQIVAENAAHLEQKWQEFAAEYNKRLTILIYDFGRLVYADFTVTFMPALQEFALANRRSVWTLPLVLPKQCDSNLIWHLSEAEDAVQRQLKEEEFAAEMLRRRQAALDKLTEEERDLLGIGK